MNTEQRLETLVRAAQFDVCGYSGQMNLSHQTSPASNSPLRFLSRAALRAARFVWYKSMLNSEKQLSFMPQLDEEDTQEPSLAGALG